MGSTFALALVLASLPLGFTPEQRYGMLHACTDGLRAHARHRSSRSGVRCTLLAEQGRGVHGQVMGDGHESCQFSRDLFISNKLLYNSHIYEYTTYLGSSVAQEIYTTPALGLVLRQLWQLTTLW